jgi:hypothetical protein
MVASVVGIAVAFAIVALGSLLVATSFRRLLGSEQALREAEGRFAAGRAPKSRAFSSLARRRTR